MAVRTNPLAHMPLLQPLIDYSMTVQGMGLEHSLAELVKIRASQLNRCAQCLHMHTADARKAGETDERMHLLAAWRESPLFSERERAALEWTEELTHLGPHGASDEAYENLKAQFSAEEQVKLTLMVTAINSWNRVNAAFRVKHPRVQRQAA